MSQYDDFEGILQQAKELSDLYEKVLAQGIPKSVEQAENEAWDVAAVFSNVGIPLPLNIGYDRDERRKDRQRMIRTEDALRIIEEFEEGLITKSVIGPKQIFMNKIHRWRAMIEVSNDLATIFMKFMDEYITEADIFDLVLWIATFGLFGDTDLVKKQLAIVEHGWLILRRFFGLIFTYALLSMGIPTFSAHLKGVTDSREETAKILRRAALPQRNVQRVWRRKVSRL